MNDSVCLEYINFVKKCIYKYFKLIMGKNFNKGIFDNLMDTIIILILSIRMFLLILIII